MSQPENSSTSSRPTVAVVIATYRREGVLVDTVRQVLDQQPAPDEVLVVDQTPDSEHELDTRAALAELSARKAIRYLRLPTPNLPRARNAALKVSTADVVVFIDDDVQLAPGFVEAHRRNYLEPHVDAVAGRVVQDWSKQPVKRSWKRQYDYRYLRLDSVEPRDGVANFMGANHSVRRLRMLAIGGYDENFLTGYREDSDAAMRLWRSGGHIRFDPACTLVHLLLPGGGCQLRNPAAKRPRWTKPYADLYFGIKHHFPNLFFFYVLFYAAVRANVVTRHNVKNPRELVLAAFAYIQALWHAIPAAVRGGTSSIQDSR